MQEVAQVPPSADMDRAITQSIEDTQKVLEQRGADTQQAQGEKDPKAHEEELKKGFTFLVDNLQDAEADSFAQEIQDFQKDFLVEGGYDNFLYIAINTDAGVGVSIAVSGKNTDVQRDLEKAIEQKTGSSVDLSDMTLADLLNFQTVVSVPGVGSRTVRVTSVDLTLRGKDAVVLGDKQFRPNHHVVSTVSSEKTSQLGEASVVDLQHPHHMEVKTGETVTIDGVKFVVTQSGLAVQRPDANGNTTASLGIGMIQTWTVEEQAAYGKFVAKYMPTYSNSQAIFNPILLEQAATPTTNTEVLEAQSFEIEGNVVSVPLDSAIQLTRNRQPLGPVIRVKENGSIQKYDSASRAWLPVTNDEQSRFHIRVSVNGKTATISGAVTK